MPLSAGTASRFPSAVEADMPIRSGAFRNLLYNLVRRDLTVRYKSTVLGFFWSFIKPLALTAIFYIVFDKIMNLRLRAEDQEIPLALHMLTGMLAWTFFSGATSEAMNVFPANANLVKKVRLPLVVFPLAAVVSHLIHFLLALIVLLALLVLFSLPPGPLFFYLPLVIGLQFFFTLAVAMILSSLNVFYRDVGSIWEVLTQAWFYATPIIYPIYYATEKLEQQGSGWLEWLYLANPLTPIVLAYRHIFLYGALEGTHREFPTREMLVSLALCVIVSLILFGVAHKVFRHFSRSFADEL